MTDTCNKNNIYIQYQVNVFLSGLHTDTLSFILSYFFSMFFDSMENHEFKSSRHENTHIFSIAWTSRFLHIIFSGWTIFNTLKINGMTRTQNTHTIQKRHFSMKTNFTKQMLFKMTVYFDMNNRFGLLICLKKLNKWIIYQIKSNKILV